jgi:penicillin-binding protein 2A
MKTGRSPDSVRPKGRKKRKGSKFRTGLLWLFFTGLFAVACAVVGYLLVILNGERILSENLNKLEMDKATRIVDAKGNEVAKLYVSQGGNRDYVLFKDIPPMVRNAFIATEDRRFYEHNGVDFWGIGRALVKDVIARQAVEGASTITQQLARNLFLNADKTIFRKGTEASIALALENHLTKDEILEKYLNRIYFGKGQYGIKTAAKYYFNVDNLKDLKLWQIATLAGIPKGPNIYNPLSNPEKSMERRRVVLGLMKDQGLITEQQMEEAAKVVYKPSMAAKNATRYPSFVDYVVSEAQEDANLTEEQLLTGGYTIETTLDTQAQKAMEDVFAKDSMFEKSKDDTEMQGAMVIMDQHTGALVAMVGGRDYAKGGWNRVTKQRQPGSSFKPIVDYGPALETGRWFPWSLLEDKLQCYDNGKYCPKNDDGEGYLGTVTMAQAIKQSRNQPAVWTLSQIGVSEGIKFADKLGIELGPEDRNLAIALGGLTQGVSPLQMVRAYGAFANGGYLQTPHSVLSIKDANGETIYEYKEKPPERVMSEKTAYYITQMLQGVVDTGGTGVRARISGRTVAGKTGTTQLGIPGVRSDENRDVWFVGYTPEWTAAVWMGYDVTDVDHHVRKGSGQAAALFSAVMSKALEGHKKLAFPKPPDVQDTPDLPKVSGLTGAYNPDSVDIELSWSAVSGDGITYKIYRKGPQDSGFKLLAEANEPSFADLAILPDQTYTYYVTAYQAKTKAESAPSDQVSVTVVSEMMPSESPPPGGDGTGSVWPPDAGRGSPGGDGSVPPAVGPGESGDGGSGGAGGGDGGPGGSGSVPNPGQGGAAGGAGSPSPSPLPSPSPSPGPEGGAGSSPSPGAGAGGNGQAPSGSPSPQPGIGRGGGDGPWARMPLLQ